MNRSKFISVIDYLRRTDSTVNEEHLIKIRNCYRQVLKLSAGAAVPEEVNENDIKEVARQLNLVIDTEKNRECLIECVKYENIDDAKVVVLGMLFEVKPLDDSISEIITHPPILQTRLISNVRQDSISLTHIDCLLNIKNYTNEVDQFIHSFLLQNIKALRQQVTSSSEQRSTSFRSNEQFCLPNGCLLDLFIRQQLRDRGTLTSNPHQNMAHFRLIEPISLTDDFGTWTYDHWRGIFDLELAPHGTNTRFPPRWSLANNAQIYCRINISDSVQTISSSSSCFHDRPRTVSLDVFVRDVCAHENNDQANTWLDELHQEDIQTYKHLANLKQTEWDNIRKLSVNAKKILKTAVDRERENIDHNRRRRIVCDPNLEEDDDDDDQIIQNNQISYSRSEVLANLHLIKLFICYTLREERSFQRPSVLPQLEAACLDHVFDEMREEGFADDGLFPKMAEFFLPLTISEQELYIDRGLDKQKHEMLKINCEQLRISNAKITADINEQTRIFWTYDENISLLEKNLKGIDNTHSKERSTIVARTTHEQQQQQQQQAHELQQLDRKWHQDQADLNKKLKDEKKLKNDLDIVIKKLEKKLNENEVRLQNIQTELAAPPKYVDKQLVKPARGLIMYGPPGTGKSEIMSKLSVKLGIVMVSPPLAAGEINRPLVGESERILIALCQRSYQIPYAMCCVSIDEIDSLAPKRDEDSSEGKVDKISVLLSLIEGIKDVPNLMILCATNRLHMMDEAFLRRMSGKFFVGRPSSKARTTILKSIPDCALEPEILDRLSIATTNFSGAAVRALTRTITVTCIATRRKKPNYRINDIEALEIADRTAQQYQILFGCETLPRLLLRNLQNGSHLRGSQLSNHLNYTGRIVVDLHNGFVRIETRTQMNGLSIIEHKLHRNETNVQSLLERLTNYGRNRNVQLLQLIDLNLLASQSAYDEKKVFETLKDRYDEYTAYTRSMIVYDLDALVGVNKSESDSNMGRSTSSSIVNQNIYTYIRVRFRDCIMEEGQQSMDKIERWGVTIIREPFLLRQFCNDVQFTRTQQEEEELEIERRKAEEQLKCVKCKDFYIENENKMGNCVHHDGFVYDNSAADLTIYTYTDAIVLLNDLECKAMNDNERRDEFERQKTKFKWICCDGVVISGNTSGCKKGKHGFNITDSDQLQQQPQPADTTRQWEETCRANEEYNDKWLTYLEKRG